VTVLSTAATTNDSDIAAIRAVIAAQFASLTWSPEKPADWDAFRATFFPDTTFIPAARPARRQSVEQFIARLRQLEADGKLTHFRENLLGATIHVFGNVAVALGTCEMLENETTVTHDVSAFLFVKDGGQWRIAAQAWDLETQENRWQRS
jgi:Domain of unknown function (DUF4440)